DDTRGWPGPSHDEEHPRDTRWDRPGSLRAQGNIRIAVDPGPGGVREVSRSLAHHQGRARSVGDLADGDTAVRVEDPGARDLTRRRVDVRRVGPAGRSHVMAWRYPLE